MESYRGLRNFEKSSVHSDYRDKSDVNETADEYIVCNHPKKNIIPKMIVYDQQNMIVRDQIMYRLSQRGRELFKC